MSERGVFAVDRGIFEHPAFQREPFTQREAWLWLVAEAAFKERSKRADGKVIHLQRGQLCHSIRFMAEAWQWSKSRVDRFLTMLENRDMLRSEIGTRIPIITICNYCEYQRVSLPERDKSGTTSGTRAGQERDKLEDTENTEITSETSSLRTAQTRLPMAGVEEQAKPRKRASRLPSDWQPDEDLKDYARQHLPDGRTCHHETEKFIKHFQSASGSTAAKLDWRAAYQKWILTASERYRDTQPRNGFAGAFNPSFEQRSGPTGARDAPRRQSSNDRLVEGLWNVMERFPDDA
ncbi:MAG: hypothetical protein J0I42_14910 [Bosea sp.]|uniref:hypothetical protein n=1 Tax=Bosea sp. (in: a-proteobacteria) TaxID=1871050 RepID=UPI001AC25CBC|nr:hypothetical protein [Bosea sp. (in: a-proteobacteria)]MBN9453236.1 hypothetical protein [Bosea sp. (in: a-proteobacteria)]